MLLYQAPNYDWSVEAKYLMDVEDKAVVASPRISPPFSKEKNISDAPSLHEPWIPTSVGDGWRNPWISARCYFIDKNKLSKYLPLLQGRILLDTLLVKYLNRGFPRTYEGMLSNRITRAGGWRLDLKSEQAWLLHPGTKPPRYFELLPQIQQAIKQGTVPDEQKGYADINHDAWEKFITQSN
jgi:hypothetical protein